jgi:hypothetical protein
VARFWKRSAESRADRELRALRAKASEDLVRRIEASSQAHRPNSSLARAAAVRAALATALTVVLLAMLAGFGTLDSAAQSVGDFVAVGQKVATGKDKDDPPKKNAAKAKDNKGEKKGGNGGGGDDDDRANGDDKKKDTNKDKDKDKDKDKGKGKDKDDDEDDDGDEEPGDDQYKITICHKTNSEGNPYVRIRVSSRAIPAHRRHGDIIPAPPGGCPRRR